jgi:hypothetical protein
MDEKIVAFSNFCWRTWIILYDQKSFKDGGLGAVAELGTKPPNCKSVIFRLSP